MKKSVRITLHVCFWALIPLTYTLFSWATQADSFFGLPNNSKSYFQILYGYFVSLFVRPDIGSEMWSLSNLTNILVNVVWYIVYPALVFYLFFGSFSPGIMKKGGYKKYLAPALFVAVLPYVIAKLSSYVIFAVNLSYIYFLSLTYIITLFYAVSGFFFYLLEHWLQNEKLARQNLQSELALLKNQINPHFLFNTLNNIDSLIKSNPEKASETLLKLSDILRYMIYDTNVPQVNLSDEISHIESYTDLQKIQFANRELATLSISGNPGNIQIAPMLFIPFVENAFKHCTDKSKPRAICFAFTISDRSVKFESVNLSDKARRINKDGASGVGLAIVKRRLELLYPGRHTLVIREENNTYNVTLSVNTHEH
jgi:sensor histidine kinase YesM